MVQRDEVLKSLRNLKSIIARRDFIHLEDMVLVTLDSNSLKLFGLNRAVQLEVSIPLESEGGYKTVLQFSKFLEIIASYPADAWLNLTFGSRNLIIKYEKNRSQIPLNKEILFPSGPIFPDTIGSEDIVFNSEALLQAFDTVHKFSSTDETRGTLCSVLMEPSGIEGYTRLVATDGMVLNTYLVTGILNSPVTISSYGVPALLLALRANIKQDCEIGEDDSKVYFTMGTHRLALTKISGTFPAYVSIIPKASKYSITVQATDFLEKLAILKTTADKSNPYVDITLEEDTFLLKTFSSSGDSEAVLDLISCPPGVTLQFRLSLDKLVKIISALKSRIIEIKIVNSLSPIIFNSESKKILGLIMPMRIS
jgi:DNA polymerase III sliding clamp (beta) subunit (PCNA family)